MYIWVYIRLSVLFHPSAWGFLVFSWGVRRIVTELTSVAVCLCFVCGTLPQHGLMSAVYVHTPDLNLWTLGHWSRMCKLNHYATRLTPFCVFFGVLFAEEDSPWANICASLPLFFSMWATNTAWLLTEWCRSTPRNRTWAAKMEHAELNH